HATARAVSYRSQLLLFRGAGLSGDSRVAQSASRDRQIECLSRDAAFTQEFAGSAVRVRANRAERGKTMEEKEHKGLTPGDNNNSEGKTSNLLNKQNALVPPSLLPTVLGRLGFSEEISMPEIAVNTLVEQLYSEDWEERLSAVRALSRLGSSAPVELLTTVL